MISKQRQRQRELGKHELRESSSTLSLSLAPQSTIAGCIELVALRHLATLAGLSCRAAATATAAVAVALCAPNYFLHATLCPHFTPHNLSAFCLWCCLWFCFCLCSGQHTATATPTATATATTTTTTRRQRWQHRTRHHNRSCVLTFFFLPPYPVVVAVVHASCYIRSYMRCYMLNPCGEKAAPHTTTQNGKLTARNSQ